LRNLEEQRIREKEDKEREDYEKEEKVVKFKEQADKQRKKIADLKRTQGEDDNGSPARSGPNEEEEQIEESPAI